MHQGPTLSDPCDLSLIRQLYADHREPLLAVRKRMADYYRQHGQHGIDRTPALWRAARPIRRWRPNLLRPHVFAQLDDICAELTYLFVRHTRPETVVEISPCDGWSSQWILQALRDNGTGRLTSFDLVDNARHKVPADLAEGRWQLVVGDAKQNLDSVPEPIDYLFLDSDHSAEFARWYLDAVVPKVRPDGFISIDDIFHHTDPSIFDGEGPVVLEWLQERGVEFLAPAPACSTGKFEELEQIRREAGIRDQVKPSRANPTIFFRTPTRGWQATTASISA